MEIIEIIIRDIISWFPSKFNLSPYIIISFLNIYLQNLIMLIFYFFIF